MLFQESWWDPAGIFIKEHILTQCMREHQKGQMRGLLECTGGHVEWEGVANTL